MISFYPHLGIPAPGGKSLQRCVYLPSPSAKSISVFGIIFSLKGMLLISPNIKGQENECQMLRVNEWGILPKSYSWQLPGGGGEVTPQPVPGGGWREGTAWPLSWCTAPSFNRSGPRSLPPLIRNYFST